MIPIAKLLSDAYSEPKKPNSFRITTKLLKKPDFREHSIE